MPRPLPPSRFRRVAKWVGIVSVALVIIAWGASVGRWCTWREDPIVVTLTTGAIELAVRRDPTTLTTAQSLAERTFVDIVIPTGVQIADSNTGDIGFDLPWQGTSSFDHQYHLPLWLPFVLFALPTAIHWRRDQRTVKRGLCVKCGYDLRASKKVCPECGAAVPMQSTDENTA